MRKNSIYIILTGNSVDVSGYCYTGGCYQLLFANCSLNIRIILEDQKVLRRSPDLLNNVKIGQGQLQHIMEQILFFTIYILVK